MNGSVKLTSGNNCDGDWWLGCWLLHSSKQLEWWVYRQRRASSPRVANDSMILSCGEISSKCNDLEHVRKPLRLNECNFDITIDSIRGSLDCCNVAPTTDCPIICPIPECFALHVIHGSRLIQISPQLLNTSSTSRLNTAGATRRKFRYGPPS